MDEKKKSYCRLLKKQKKERDWDSMLLTAQEAISYYPSSHRFRRALRFAQSNYLSEHLKSPLLHDLEKQESYEELRKIYLRLQKVFPNSKRLKRRLKKVNLAISVKANEESKKVIKDMEEKMKSLARDHKIEEAMELCYELLSQIPNHKLSLKIRRKMLKEREAIINKDIDISLKRSHELTLKEREKDKNTLIRI